MSLCCSCCCAGPKVGALANAAAFAVKGLSPALIADLVFWYKFNEAPGSTTLINYAPSGAARDATKLTDETHGSSDFDGQSLLIVFPDALSASTYPGFEINSTFVFPVAGNRLSLFTVCMDPTGNRPAGVSTGNYLGGQGANGLMVGYVRNGGDTFRSHRAADGSTDTDFRAHNITTEVSNANFLNRIWLVNYTTVGALAGNGSMRINRTAITPSLNNAVTYSVGSQTWHIGRGVNGTPWNGHLYYMMGFNRDLTAAEQITVENFIVKEMNKRGVTIIDGP